MTRIDVSNPQFNQNTYWGRARHFFATTNPLNLLVSSKALEESRQIVVYDSAFHPETDQKMLIVGRMSAQVPMNMAITGCMLSYYRSTPAVVFWQWFNQSFNAVVNYTNRSGKDPLPLSQTLTSYLTATSGALITALSLNRLAARAPPLVGRFVPFAAVSAANCVNIPLMRSKELREGILVFDSNGQEIGKSKIAAKLAITQVVISRIAMAAPGMTLPPILMDALEKRGVLGRMPWIAAPLQVALCGVFLTFTTPMCCALFPQTASVAISRLEPELQSLTNCSAIVNYNKGL
ncbi:sideroflexin-1-like [Oppia nitens]|uniref:sideroflexin-1-like n=1 Tax=Oppia nitens TaxID=1686743 RepID=UPI0023DABB0E|nr:sideroflexin-1-like [Oppia nitens]